MPQSTKDHNEMRHVNRLFVCSLLLPYMQKFIVLRVGVMTLYNWIQLLSLGQPKVNKIKIFLPFPMFIKRPQTKFHAHTTGNPKLLGQKKVKIYR